MAQGKASVNKVILLGRLGFDPEMTILPSGTKVTTLSVATTQVWKKDNKKQEETEWHRVVAWNQLAQIADDYLRKGSLVYLEGRLHTRRWEDEGGQKQKTTEVIADLLTLLESQSAADAADEEKDTADSDSETSTAQES
jgi:single-strand DNA-binding protein